MRYCKNTQVGSDSSSQPTFYFDTSTIRRIEPLGEIARQLKVNVKRSLVHDTIGHSDRPQRLPQSR